MGRSGGVDKEIVCNTFVAIEQRTIITLPAPDHNRLKFWNEKPPFGRQAILSIKPHSVGRC